ncbi:MAG: DUF4332 domain-containing protein [Hyphomicrobiaceae bacterium]
MGYKIEAVEGIGRVHGDTLRRHGITRTDRLLERASTRKGRKELADQTGIDEGLILKWANCCDLMRVRGIAEEYSELLEVAGVDTVKELRNRRADNLLKAMTDANEKRRLVRQLPGQKQVERWIEHAKTLPPLMQY